MIGKRLGLLVLLTMVLASCDSSKMRSVAAENARLKAELQRMEKDVERKVENAIDDASVESHILAQEREEKALVDRELERLQAEIRKLETQLQEAKVDDMGISVSHTRGVARLEFARLPVELQEKFGYESDVAKKARARELEARGASLSGADRDAMSYAEYERKTAKKRSKAEEERDRAYKERAIDTLEVEIRRQRNAIATLRDKMWDNESSQSSARVYGRTSAASANNNQIRAEIKRLSDWLAAAEVRLRRMKDSL